MAGVTVKYKDETIVNMKDSGTKVLETSGTYCEGDIEIEYISGTISLQSKTVAPTASSQTVEADSGYDGLSDVTVSAVPTEQKSIVENGTYTPSSGKFFDSVVVNVAGGGNPNVKTGTFTVDSDVSSSTNTKITDAASIGFTPKAFMLVRSVASSTSHHMQQTTFATAGNTHYRTLTYRSSSAYSTTTSDVDWTTQTSGYLYFNSNNVYYRSSSSYLLAAGTYYWVAFTWQ